MDRIEASGLSPEEFAAAPSLAEIDLAVEADDAADVQEAMTECGELVEAYLDEPRHHRGGGRLRPRRADQRRCWPSGSSTRISELPGSAELDAAVEAVDACDAD